MFFNKDLWFLDNCYPSQIITTLNDIEYSFGSVEAAYSASMYDDSDLHLMFTHLWGYESVKKRKNIKVNKIKNWNKLKYKIMYELLVKKFSIEDNAERLINLKGKIIYEDKVKDKVILWGYSKKYKEDRNVLGIMLMDLRRKLRHLNKINVLDKYTYDPYKNPHTELIKIQNEKSFRKL